MVEGYFNPMQNNYLMFQIYFATGQVSPPNDNADGTFSERAFAGDRDQRGKAVPERVQPLLQPGRGPQPLDGALLRRGRGGERHVVGLKAHVYALAQVAEMAVDVAIRACLGKPSARRRRAAPATNDKTNYMTRTSN